MNKIMNIGALVLDEELQSREEIDEAMVSEFVEDLKSGDEFPPVLVYFCGVNYWLTDGFHRYHAHKRIERVSILCEVVNGTRRDAILRSVRANDKHGKRRTNADKRKGVMKLLDDFEWSGWSNAAIAKECRVSPTFVANLRDSGGPAEVKYKTSGGNVATKVKAPGRAAKEPTPKEPELKEPAPEPKVEEYDPRDELIEHLTKENDELTMNLALAHMGGTEEEKGEAREIINTLREEVRVLKIELAAVKQSRDTFQSENQQLKAQVMMQQRQLKKLG